MSYFIIYFYSGDAVGRPFLRDCKIWVNILTYFLILVLWNLCLSYLLIRSARSKINLNTTRVAKEPIIRSKEAARPPNYEPMSAIEKYSNIRVCSIKFGII
jgi:hypothetical protein